MCLGVPVTDDQATTNPGLPDQLVAIAWDDAADAVRLLDQTLLPGRTEIRAVRSTAELVRAIAELAVRGAPALGVAGALGVVLALDEAAREGWDDARRDAAIDAVRDARPTAVNLAWGVDQVRPLVGQGRDAVLAAARDLATADTAANRELSRQAADWLLERVARPRLRALTHCNAGALATSGWGTALGVLRELHERGRLEARLCRRDPSTPAGSPAHGIRLAAMGVPHVVQVDSAAASTILRGLVDFAVVGADRIAANGDTANKVGTLGVALACDAAGIPLLVAAPWSTVDLTTPAGSGIVIEERPSEEVVSWAGERTAPVGTVGFNPAFDVTPGRWVSAIATERGLVEPARGSTPRDLSGT